MPKQKQTRKSIPWFWYAGGAVLIVVIAVGLYFGFAGSRPQSNTTNDTLALAKGQVIDGIRCETSESLLFHIHIQLTIFIEGQEQTVPANIGILSNCLYWLHTHDDTGLIHVESPIQRDFTLGDFFDIWGKPLSSQRLLDKTVDAEHSVRAYVDGQLYLGDPRAIALKDLEKIALMYGPPFPNP